MRARLVAGSRSGFCFLFDPASLTHLRGRGLKDLSHLDLWEAEATLGNLFYVNLCGDGKGKDDCSFEIAVDEPLRPEWAGPGIASETGLVLRLPTGTLRAAGPETLGEEPGPDSQVSLPPGVYRINANMPDPELEKARRPTPLWERVGMLGCLASFGVFAVVLGLGMAGRSRAAWISAGIVIAFWTAYFLWFKLSGKQAEEERREHRELLEGTPTAALAMTRLPDEAPEGMGGGLSF